METIAVWYLHTEQGELGPYTTEEMHSWLAAGRISVVSLVWREGFADWRPVAEVPELMPPLPPAAPERPAGGESRRRRRTVRRRLNTALPLLAAIAVAAVFLSSYARHHESSVPTNGDSRPMVASLGPVVAAETGIRTETMLAAVSVRRTALDEWELLVQGERFFVRGVGYSLVRFGEAPVGGALPDWTVYDFNGNGRCDGPYDAWVDLNHSGLQEANEPAVGDFKLLQAMGANTIRWYHNGNQRPTVAREILRDLFLSYGIRVIVGDRFGAGTGADYRDSTTRTRLLADVERMVRLHKDEPYVLLWLLGDGNNAPDAGTGAALYPVEYCRLLNQAARLIHEIDPQHPVAIANAELGLLDAYRRNCLDVDILGVNTLRGPHGFGDLWRTVKRTWDRPVLITSYGAAASGDQPEAQLEWHRECWQDIVANRAGDIGAGNSLGGVASDWIDGWWQAGSPGAHAAVSRTDSEWIREWNGLIGQGNGQHSPFLRNLRKVYYLYRDQLWKRPVGDVTS